MSENVAELESDLNDFDAARRRAALEALLDRVKRGDIAFPEPRPIVNLHGHTFFSFNGYGYSPTCFAWKARRAGLLAAGIVDFDVLDGVDEFLEAGRLLGLRTVAGIETRVFIPAFGDKVMNSPGEPGVAYYMGVGFTTKASADATVLDELKTIAQRRNLRVLERVNPYLHPVEIDYERDVLPLTPSGNATERHLCMAYDAKARTMLLTEADLVAFWAAKLGADDQTVRKALENPPIVQGLIRSTTMKAGGVGYVKADGPDFPTLERVARFALQAGAIPTYAWLDGTTNGEEDIQRLLDVVVAAGTKAVNIIPDRNWNIKDADLRKKKVARLHAFVALARERDLPISVGTEMNAYGQPFADDFDVPEMSPLREDFLRSAYIFYAHTLLQRNRGMGYLSPWAEARFASVREKNRFFEEFGRKADPAKPETLSAEPVA